MSSGDHSCKLIKIDVNFSMMPLYDKPRQGIDDDDNLIDKLQTNIVGGFMKNDFLVMKSCCGKQILEAGPFYLWSNVSEKLKQFCE